MRCKIIFSTLMLCLGILDGCGAARPSKFYQLAVPGSPAPGAEPAAYPVTLLIGSIGTSSLYRDDRIVYTSNGEAMGAYEYERWAEPPSEMIRGVLFRELRASGRYQGIYSLHSDVHGDYVLRGHLFDLRELDGKVLAARVTFEFELHDSRTGATVWRRYYSHDEPVDGKSVPAVVAALNRNVLSGLNEVTEGLDQYFSSHKSIGSTTTN
jgi:cholesterol transport system auxiliary component